MRRAVQLLNVLLYSSAFTIVSASASEYSPFTNPLYNFIANEPNNNALLKRQGCPNGYNDCSSLGAGGTCCPSNTNCAIDQAGNVACCPNNALCTGFISGTISGTVTQTSGSAANTGTSSGFVLGTTTSSTSATTATTNFITGTTQATGVAGGGSTVNNQFYPFVFIPTSYANAALCSSAWTSCQSESTSCFASLAGTFGVTVTGVAGGTTQAGGTGTIASSASSICSSLSASACYNLQVTQCSSFGGGGNTAVQSGAGGPRQTGCPGMMYAAGAVVGAVGVMI